MENHLFIIRTILPDRKNYFNYLDSEIGDYVDWCFDENRNGFKNFLKSLKMTGNKSCVHMEDDIILTSNFITKINEIIKEHNKEVIQFFSMRGKDISIGPRYENGRTFMMCQCFYFPCNYSKLLLDYYDIWEDRKNHPIGGYDMFIADFLKKRKEKYFLYVPSLVQHRIGIFVINKKRPRKRQSLTFR